MRGGLVGWVEQGESGLVGWVEQGEGWLQTFCDILVIDLTYRILQGSKRHTKCSLNLRPSDL